MEKETGVADVAVSKEAIFAVKENWALICTKRLKVRTLNAKKSLKKFKTDKKNHKKMLKKMSNMNKDRLHHLGLDKYLTNASQNAL